MFIKAVSEDYSVKEGGLKINKLQGVYEGSQGFHFVKNDPSVIWGHPGMFENPFKLRYLEIEPIGKIINPYDDETYSADTIKIKREISLTEVRNMTPRSKQAFDVHRKRLNLSNNELIKLLYFRKLLK
ncbi:hypothetical protein DET54_114101 [Paenibacillus pabuli]|uniref:Uncharacterized protein n=1 Tax=Paenibacillus pabuli TaxID=1472 RepID=A0ABX9BEZ0_9BACL|nr:hypothetical protein [Paenibacillus pabuli]RAI89633.1 hypothetical protein DET54_114101 [Paenibacillus pabuli]